MNDIQRHNTQNYLSDKGTQELKARGFAPWVTLNNMAMYLNNGFCSQDDYDLFLDVWSTATYRYSLTDSEVLAAIKSLAARYHVNLKETSDERPSTAR